MAHGACTSCGCAFEECECPVRRTKKVKVQVPHMVPGDWVRVRRGHELAGAAGCIKHIDRSRAPALVRVRQLNGHEFRLPLGLFEFVSYAGQEPDVL